MFVVWMPKWIVLWWCLLGSTGGQSRRFRVNQSVSQSVSVETRPRVRRVRGWKDKLIWHETTALSLRTP